MVKQAGKKGRPPAPAVPGKLDIRTVARLANVSIATVSRTINRVSTVNPKMAKRVWEAIEKLDYFPNTQARALVSGRSRLLGLIVSEITNPFFPELIQGFEDIAVEHGYEILISSTNYDPRRMSLCIRRMLERRAEGVAVMTFGVEKPLLEQLAERNVPLVFVDVGPERPGISLLRVDYRHGIQQGVEHLAALGHRDIAFISGPKRLHSAQSRLVGFYQVARGVHPQGRSGVDCGRGPHHGGGHGGHGAAAEIEAYAHGGDVFQRHDGHWCAAQALPGRAQSAR